MCLLGCAGRSTARARDATYRESQKTWSQIGRAKSKWAIGQTHGLVQIGMDWSLSTNRSGSPNRLIDSKFLRIHMNIYVSQSAQIKKKSFTESNSLVKLDESISLNSLIGKCLWIRSRVGYMEDAWVVRIYVASILDESFDPKSTWGKYFSGSAPCMGSPPYIRYPGIQVPTMDSMVFMESISLNRLID